MAVIDEKILLEQRAALEKDFNETQGNIKRVETEIGNMKSNFNAIYGAIQQVDKLISLSKDEVVAKPKIEVEEPKVEVEVKPKVDKKQEEKK